MKGKGVSSSTDFSELACQKVCKISCPQAHVNNPHGPFHCPEHRGQIFKQSVQCFVSECTGSFERRRRWVDAASQSRRKVKFFQMQAVFNQPSGCSFLHFTLLPPFALIKTLNHIHQAERGNGQKVSGTQRQLVWELGCKIGTWGSFQLAWRWVGALLLEDMCGQVRGGGMDHVPGAGNEGI